MENKGKLLGMIGFCLSGASFFIDLLSEYVDGKQRENEIAEEAEKAATKAVNKKLKELKGDKA